MQKKSFDLRYSYIRIIGCLAVVVLHTVFVAFTIHREEISASAYRITQGLVHNMMWAVPAFVMVSGALLLDPGRQVTYRKLFAVYIRRVLAALAVSCVAFRLFDMVMNREAFSPKVIGEGLMNILTGQTWGQMWYLYLLIGLYLLLPFYKKVSAASSDREILYLLAVYFVFESLFLLFGLTTISTAFYIHVSSIYPFYLFAGYYMSKRRDCGVHPAVCILVFIIVTVMLIALTNLEIRSGNDRLELFFGYSSPLVVIQGVSFYAFMIRLPELRQGRLAAVIMDLDNATFGIYLIHLAFIRLIIRYREINPYENGIWFVLTVIISFFGSYVIVTAYKHIVKIVKNKRS